MEVKSFLPLGRGCQLFGGWRYPKQMTWPPVVTTTLPLATAGEDVTGESLTRFANASGALNAVQRVRLSAPS